MRIPSGKTDQYIYFVAVDSTDLKTRKTGLTTFTAYRSRNGGTATVYTTPTVIELSAANMPGVYALLIDEDTTIASTSDSEEYCLQITQASMAPVTRTIELYRRDTTSGNTLDVTATGAAGVDWGNVENKTTTNALTNTSIITTQKVDVETIKTNPVVNAGTITFPTTATLASTTNITAAAGCAVSSLGANVLTAAATATDFGTEIATAIWTDTTAGDFTVAASIGKSVMNGVALGTGLTINAYTGNTVQTGDSFARIGVAGAGLTNIDLPNQTMDITGNITGNLSGSVGSVTGAVGSVAAGGITAASIATDAIDADALAADAVTEIWNKACTEPTAVVGASPTVIQAMSFLNTLARNKITQTATTQTLFADDGATPIAASTLSDDGTTFTKGEFA